MVDPTLPTIVLSSAYFGKQYLEKIFGPTCDYLGNRLKEYVKSRIENIENICKKAEQLDIEEKFATHGAISPRILNELIRDGSFIEEELVQTYFAGILLSSRDVYGNDDRGLYYLDIIKKLSSFDIRLHFYLYLAFRNQFLDSIDSLSLYKTKDNLLVFLPLSELFKFLLMDIDSHNLFFDRINESLNRIKKEGLLSEYIFSNMKFELQKRYNSASEGGIVMIPSSLGCLLLLWALGIKDEQPHYLCSTRLEIERKIEALGLNTYPDTNEAVA
jgi:hypothetical protein